MLKFCRLTALTGLLVFAPFVARAEDDTLPSAPSAVLAQQGNEGEKQQAATAGQVVPADTDAGQQTKRILGIIPNFRSVSVDEKLPPQTVKEKFVTTSQDTFDYSDFIFVGLLSGVAQAQNSYPQFGHGAVGYGRYYWHTLADQVSENYVVEFIFPSVLHHDTRYYTLEHGSKLKRAGYAMSRILITRTDSGHETFNTSEIVGSGAASAISAFYYPSSERTWSKIGQRWATSVSLDATTLIFKEFWPDINNAFFRRHRH